jgi:hypothetical protein
MKSHWEKQVVYKINLIKKVMIHTQTNFSNGIPMPLLMGYTPAMPIQTMENVEPIIYDPILQIVYDTRTVGTKCRKSTHKKLPGGSTNTDWKNEMDDSKNVK